MSERTCELERLAVPEIPSYKRKFVELVGSYLCSRPDLQIVSDIRPNFRSFPYDGIKPVNRGRGISSAGVAIFGYASEFLDKNVNLQRLSEAEKALSKGLANLEKYEVREKSLAAVHDLKGYVDLPYFGGLIGGKAPIEGELQERKPSAFSSFSLPKDQKKEYLDALGGTLASAYDGLREGFKSKGNDKKFKILMQSLFSSKKINFSQVIAVNDHVRSVHDDAAVTCKLARYFEEHNLTRLHSLTMGQRSERLREEGLKIMHPYAERFFSHEIVKGAGIWGGFGGGTIIMTGAVASQSLLLGVLGAGVLAEGFYSLLSTKPAVIEREKEVLWQIQYLQAYQSK